MAECFNIIENDSKDAVKLFADSSEEASEKDESVGFVSTSRIAVRYQKD